MLTKKSGDAIKKLKQDAVISTIIIIVLLAIGLAIHNDSLLGIAIIGILFLPFSIFTRLLKIKQELNQDNASFPEGELSRKKAIKGMSPPVEIVFIQGNDVISAKQSDTTSHICSVCGKEAHVMIQRIQVGTNGGRILNAHIAIKGQLSSGGIAKLAGECVFCNNYIHLNCTKPLRMPGGTVFRCSCGQGYLSPIQQIERVD